MNLQLIKVLGRLDGLEDCPYPSWPAPGCTALKQGLCTGRLVEGCVEPLLGLNVFASVFYETTYCFIVCSILESTYFKSVFCIILNQTGCNPLH